MGPNFVYVDRFAVVTKGLSSTSYLGMAAPFVKVFIIRGIGYQADVVEVANRDFPFSRYLSLRLGHSELICKPIPNYIGIKTAHKDRKVIIYGSSKSQVSNFAKEVFKLRPPSVYTGRGVRIKKGQHRRKLGKKDIRKGKV
jgi:large subunit ribosomal protein L6